MNATTISKHAWSTYAVAGYTHQVGSDPRATGGVHLHQVRRVKVGWQKRIVDSNGNFRSPGRVEAIDRVEGEALFARAKQS